MSHYNLTIRDTTLKCKHQEEVAFRVNCYLLLNGHLDNRLITKHTIGNWIAKNKPEKYDFIKIEKID